MDIRLCCYFLFSSFIATHNRIVLESYMFELRSVPHGILFVFFYWSINFSAVKGQKSEYSFIINSSLNIVSALSILAFKLWKILMRKIIYKIEQKYCEYVIYPKLTHDNSAFSWSVYFYKFSFYNTLKLKLCIRNWKRICL